jgi:dienelactone hydrolase
VIALVALAALAAGVHERELEHDGQTVRYTLRIPKGKGPHPVVLALHYAGEVTPWYGRGVLDRLVAPALESVNPIIVAPDCPGLGWTDPASVSAALAVLDAVSAELRVDPDRTLVTGFSMGGIGTWHIALAHPERFTVAAPVAGLPPGDTSALTLPIAIVHSAADTVIPIGPTEAAVTALRDRDHPVRFTRLPSVPHHDVPGHVQALRAMVPWIEACWAE